MRQPMRAKLLLVTGCCLLGASMASAEVPRLIRYQGFLKDSQGVALQGPYNLTFRLYPAETGGTPVWTEPQTNIQIDSGSFSVLLGGSVALDAVDWSAPLWLSIQVNTDAELSPRQQITSVPLALRSAVAESLATPVTTSNITDDANRLVPSGAIILWTAASCPAGYTRVSSMDDKFLVSGSVSNADAGGSNTKDISHTHGPGTYAVPLAAQAGAGGSISTPILTGIVGTSGIGGSKSLDIRPAFATVLLCKKD